MTPPVLPAPPTTSAVSNTPMTPPVNHDAIAKVIDDGLVLEKEHRWGEVLTMYEAALRAHQNDSKILNRYRYARCHYDTARRILDSSYVKTLQTFSVVSTLQLYEEVLAKIEIYYVDSPVWDDLFRFGVQNIDIALSNVTFQTTMNLRATPEKIEACRQQWRQMAAGWEIRSKEDLKNGMLWLAKKAQQEIDLNPSATILEFTCGITNSLDHYTGFLTPNQYKDQLSTISGDFVGIGVELKSDLESLLILRVLEGSPARAAGLRDGDRIHSINGIATKGRDTDSAADLLQGEENSTFRLTVQSQGEQQSREIQVVRQKFEMQSVEDVHMLNPTVGYIRLTGFQTKTTDEMRMALWKLHQEGMRSLVLDLRHNPGGLLEVGLDVASLFIESGALLREKGREANEKIRYATGKGCWKVPLVLLIDEESASAAEIVAGAIRDHGRGMIIGKRSFGKGVIQIVLPLNEGQVANCPAGIRLTTEKFFSPRGLPFSGVGVSPNIEIQTQPRVLVAKPFDGQMTIPSIPVVSRTVSSSLDDPCIHEAVKVLTSGTPAIAVSRTN